MNGKMKRETDEKMIFILHLRNLFSNNKHTSISLRSKKIESKKKEKRWKIAVTNQSFSSSFFLIFQQNKIINFRPIIYRFDFEKKNDLFDAYCFRSVSIFLHSL